MAECACAAVAAAVPPREAPRAPPFPGFRCRVERAAAAPGASALRRTVLLLGTRLGDALLAPLRDGAVVAPRPGGLRWCSSLVAEVDGYVVGGAACELGRALESFSALLVFGF